LDEIKFRFATNQDETAVKQFLEANDLLYQDIEPAGLKNFLLAWDASDMVGLVGLQIEEDCALLRSLAVKQDYRNRGLATLLVHKIEDHARTLRIKTLHLLTMTAEDFFTGRDFQRTARETAPIGIQKTAEFKELCPASAAFMTKKLPMTSARSA